MIYNLTVQVKLTLSFTSLHSFLGSKCMLREMKVKYFYLIITCYAKMITYFLVHTMLEHLCDHFDSQH